jgi:hypothetical protein
MLPAVTTCTIRASGISRSPYLMQGWGGVGGGHLRYPAGNGTKSAWFHLLNASAICNNNEFLLQSRGLVKVGSRERKRMMLLHACTGQLIIMCAKTPLQDALQSMPIHLSLSLRRSHISGEWSGEEQMSLMGASVCNWLHLSSVYVCMGGTHIISMLYWSFDVLHKRFPVDNMEMGA